MALMGIFVCMRARCEALEEGSRLYYAEHDVNGMIEVLKPLHEMMLQGPQTLRYSQLAHSEDFPT